MDGSHRVTTKWNKGYYDRTETLTKPFPLN